MPPTTPTATVDQMAVDVTAFNGIAARYGSAEHADGTLTISSAVSAAGQNDSPVYEHLEAGAGDKTPLGHDASHRGPRPTHILSINGLKHSLGLLEPSRSARRRRPRTGDPPSAVPLAHLEQPALTQSAGVAAGAGVRSSKLLVNAGTGLGDPNYSKYFRFVEAAVSPYTPRA